MTSSKGFPATETESRNKKSDSLAGNIFGFGSKNMKKIVIGLAVIVFLSPFLSASSPGLAPDLKNGRSEVHILPGGGNEQASAEHESNRQKMMVAPSNQMNAPLPDEELMAIPGASRGLDKGLARNASPEALNSNLKGTEAGPSDSQDAAIDAHQKDPKASWKTLKSLKKEARGSSDDALSLLWIVILVVLLLWLLGVIAGGLGLGGLIHILLVIALILLILWLIRAI
jgi:hypothetical protein